MNHGVFGLNTFLFTERGVVVSPFAVGKTSQQWTLHGDRVEHRFNPNWVISADGNVNSIFLCTRKYDNSADQMWITEYV